MSGLLDYCIHGCRHCTLSFGTVEKLRGHYALYHPGIDLPVMDEGDTFGCPSCERNFYAVNNLKDHFEKRHGGVPPKPIGVIRQDDEIRCVLGAGHFVIVPHGDGVRVIDSSGLRLDISKEAADLLIAGINSIRSRT